MCTTSKARVCSEKQGTADVFREIPITSAPNTVPIPTPAPASPIVASPARKV